MTDEDTTPDCLESLIPPAKAAKISDRGQRFVDEYMIDLNAARAARECGYKIHKFPSEIAVITELERRRKEIGDELKITGARVLMEYARVAFLDLRKLFNEDGTPKDFMKLGADVRAAIGSMDVETQGQDKNWKTVTKYKFVSKLTALEALAKHLGLFPKDTQDQNNNNIATGSIADMSENEQARRLSHILHTAMKTVPLLNDVEEEEVEPIEGEIISEDTK